MDFDGVADGAHDSAFNCRQGIASVSIAQMHSQNLALKKLAAHPPHKLVWRNNKHSAVRLPAQKSAV